ncbi:MAG TPA: family 1 encapsulin nanocompartment shell protein, partial [Solirubrobacterales bacterium]|nr:family 1 encapsulin nanocompartment shell protein [Solirubrobacterales bacterium]
MNHLLRGHAPLTDSNWKLLDDEARERLAGPLAARRLVDFVGPRGWEHSATNLGRVEPVEGAEPGVTARRRRVLPLVEVRVDFAVSRAEMRDDDRGAVDVDLESLDNAAHQIAVCENSAVFNGWARAGIQ